LSLGRPSSRNNNNNNNNNGSNSSGLESFNLNSIVGVQAQQQQQRLYNSGSDTAYLNSNAVSNVVPPLSTPELSPFDNSFGATSSNASVSLPSPMTYDGFDDPLTGSRHSFRGSLSDVDGVINPFSSVENPDAAAHTFSEIQR
jgi:hypothetical protein